MNKWPESLLNGVLFVVLTGLIGSFALNAMGWLFRYLLVIPL